MLSSGKCQKSAISEGEADSSPSATGDQAMTRNQQNSLGPSGVGVNRKLSYERRPSAQSQRSVASSSTSSGSSSGSSSTSVSASFGTSGAGEKTSSLSSRKCNSGTDYDTLRSQTLMFFLDRLFMASKDGKEAHTLHDLSCLFGTKDFTPEMRQIVGASRNGLKKFLQSQPSLFTIEGDKVYLTQLKQDNQPPARNYSREASDYFTQKLLQFGTSFVPIKNLFGYRSQATPEVRHVSGKSSKEFKEFLESNDDVFTVIDDHVVLRSAYEKLKSGEDCDSLEFLSLQQQTLSIQSQSQHPNEDFLTDPYLNKQFALAIEQMLRKMWAGDTKSNLDETNNNAVREKNDEPQDGRKIRLEELHEKVKKEFHNQPFLKMVETLDELRNFIRMHPKLFKRFISCADNTNDSQIEFVRLLNDDERKEFELQSYPQQASSLASRQHSILRRSETNESEISESSSLSVSQPLSLPPNLISQQQSQRSTSSAMSVANNAQSPKSLGVASNANISLSKVTREEISLSSGRQHQSLSRTSSSSLRANAPAFVPLATGSGQRQQVDSLSQLSSSHLSSRKGQLILRQTSSRQQANQPANIIQRSLSSIVQPSRGSRPHRLTAESRQSFRSHVVKANALNVANDLHSSSKQSDWASASSQYGGQMTKPAVTRQETRQDANGDQSQDNWRARTIHIVKETANIITRIMSCTDVVAFDCKGYNLGFNGEITLIQLGFVPNMNSKKSKVNDTQSPREQNDNNSSDKSEHEDNFPAVCIFDLITNPELAYFLKPLLESEHIVKVVHDVRNKSNALYVQFGIMIKNVFDTQVANLVIQQQDTGVPAYKSRYISMSKLCEIYGDEKLRRNRRYIESKTRHSANSHQSGNGKAKDVNYWRNRPVTDSMVHEATTDVYCLICGIYQSMKSKIKPQYKPLFDQLNAEGVLARIKPDEIRSVKKERKIDLEVIDLKRKLYQDSMAQIVLSNREIRLLRHIDLTDKVRQKIQQCKKVAKKLERLDMKAAQMLQHQSSITSQITNSTTTSNGDHEEHESMMQSLDCSLNINSVDRQSNSLLTNGSSHSSRSSNSSSSSLSAGLAVMATTASSKQVVDGNGESCNSRAACNGAHLAASALSAGCSISPEAAVIDKLMDSSSMFDELKDKMNESSNLLKALEDDDEDEIEVSQLASQVASSSRRPSEATVDGRHHDCCKCNCHRGSMDSTANL